MAQLIGRTIVRSLRCVQAPNLSILPNSRVYSSTYKSQYAIENLYPHIISSKSSSTTSPQISLPDGKFTGYIPIDDLQITYSRSSGPGGQNVNKVNTKVEIRFHVESAKWIPERLKTKLLTAEAGRITRQGYLVLRSEKTRSQLLNQADCLDKLRALIYNCDIEPHQPTAEELEIVKQRQSKAKAGILREKRDYSLKKQFRQAPSSSDV